jgi:hypothetical protein
LVTLHLRGWTWREGSALAALLLLLILCLPIFLCMAPWVDATFYDICARIIQRGGVLYRDSFDTNLPGMAWLHLVIRSLFGWRSEVIRAADVVVVAAIAVLLVRWDLNLPRHGRMWTAFALLAFYFSTSEWCQNQRDVWMLLPSLMALYLRRNQILVSRSISRTLLLSGLEGILWGAAVWIKPMALFPAVVCCSIGAICRRPLIWRAVAAEGVGLLSGGLLVGGLGLLWLWRTGAWEPFWDILLNWNPEYQKYFMHWPRRWQHLKFWCVTNMPWCLVHGAALPLAVVSLASAIRHRDAPSPERLTRTLLAMLYMSWIAQVLLFQGWYPYHWTPPVLLALTVLATWFRIPAASWWRFALAFHMLLFVALAAFAHPVLQPRRLAMWWACVTEGSTNRLRDALALTPQQGVAGGASDWEDLERIATFLREQALQEDEPLCLHESTMPLYLELDRSPAVRYLFYGQATGIYPRHRQQIVAELSTTPARYAVSDLEMIHWRPSDSQNPPRFSKPMAESFPWSEPIVYRSGRYTVHRLDEPIRKLWP